jgi:hypothetical protein
MNGMMKTTRTMSMMKIMELHDVSDDEPYGEDYDEYIRKVNNNDKFKG